MNSCHPPFRPLRPVLRTASDFAKSNMVAKLKLDIAWRVIKAGIPLAYLHDLFDTYDRDFVNTYTILALIANFVNRCIDAALTEGIEQDAFIAETKHIFIGMVSKSPICGNAKQAILALPLNDLARKGIVNFQHLRPYLKRERVQCVANWIIACAAHPSAATNNDLALKFSRTIEPRYPRVPRDTSNNWKRQVRDAAIGHRGPFPGLTRALCEAYGDRSPASTENICHILRVFIQMAMDTTEAHNLRREMISSARYGGPQFDHVMFEDALFFSFAVTVVGNPTVLPVPVRRILAKSNYKGNLTFLVRTQQTLPREESRTMLHYSMYKWIIEAALHPNTGLSHVIRPLVEKHFEMPWLDPTFTKEDVESFRPRGMNYYAVRELESRIRQATISFSSDMPLQAIGPRNDPRACSHSMHTVPMEQICTICQTEFEDGDECVMLQNCADVLHLECLDTLINGVYPGMEEVRCPNCRSSICAAREYVADQAAAGES